MKPSAAGGSDDQPRLPDAACAPPDGRVRERESMVADQLIARGICDPHVLAVMRSVPRHWFVGEKEAPRAYEDGALPTECGQTISQPYIVARMTELLRLSPQHVVLEIGAGTGYQTAILARLARQVWAVEWHLKLIAAAEARLRYLGIDNVALRCGDGSIGWPQHGPYDAILVAAAAPELPLSLLEQLADGGRMIVPIGSLEEQTLTLVQKTGNAVRKQAVFECRFVKLVGAEGWKEID